MTEAYYDQFLAAERLRRVYDLAPPRVQQYLQAEIQHVCRQIEPGDRVLELGCGYGRVLVYIIKCAGDVYGIDTSRSSLALARQLLSGQSRARLVVMNAVQLGFPDRCFDKVICIQNGISAFHVDQRSLIAEAVRVTKMGGRALFSSYADGFWDKRLEWFELQARDGLLGEIDYEKSGNGIIACKDGFTATTVRLEDFLRLTSGLDGSVNLVEVDSSSLFCEIAL